MDTIKIRSRLRQVNWVLFGLAALFIIVWKTPHPGALQDVALMPLPIHILAESLSITVAIILFALVMSTGAVNRPSNLVILAYAFLIVGCLDFAHTMSYSGMPDFVTPNNVEKSIYFWLFARYVAAIALLIVAVRPWEKLARPSSRYWLLAGSIAITAFLFWLGLYHLDVWPRTFIEGQGLTPFKIGAEYGVIAILLVSAAFFYRQAKQPKTFDASGLYAAAAVTILSELCFTLYANEADLFILMGYIYKVIAYCFIYWAIFVSSAREPYQKILKDREYNRTLFESSSIGFAICDMDGLLVDINQAYADIIGRSVEETQQLTYWQITSDDYAEQEKRQLENLSTTKCYGPYKKEYLHKDGHRVPVRLSGRLMERDGQTFIWSSVEDISEEVAADRARYDSEQNFQQLAENIREVFWLTDIERKSMIYIGPAYEKIWGRTCESLYANPTSFLDAIHADDRERVKQAIMRQKDGPYHEEYRIVRPDGAFRWVKEQSFPIQDQDGVTYRVAGVAEDITEKKLAHELLEQRVAERTRELNQEIFDRKIIEKALQESEERFALTTTGSGDGLWDADVTSGYVWYSEPYRNLLGYENENDYPNTLKTWADGLHPDDREATIEAYNSHVEKGTPYNVEFRLLTKQGEWRWFHGRGSSLRNEFGKSYRVAGAITDIT